jgi:hypothetical protein
MNIFIWEFIIQHLLNVFVQLANKRGLKKNHGQSEGVRKENLMSEGNHFVRNSGIHSWGPENKLLN